MGGVILAEREETRAEIEARRAADPWLWLEELLEWNRRNGSQMLANWDTPPDEIKG
jgi:hypothetical protein